MKCMANSAVEMLSRKERVVFHEAEGLVISDEGVSSDLVWMLTTMLNKEKLQSKISQLKGAC